MTLAELAQNIPRLQADYSLLDVNFDTECLYDLGDLSALLRRIVDECLPELPLRIQEKLSADKTEFVATVATDKASVVFTAPVDDDWLPDQFFEQLESLPAAFGSDKKFYSINPAIGLTGQEAWYFCGTETQLVAARQAGLPLVFPGEDFMETAEYEQYSDE
jgi:hypothetical protein